MIGRPGEVRIGSGSEICDLPNEATDEPWEPSFSGSQEKAVLGAKKLRPVAVDSDSIRKQHRLDGESGPLG